MHLIIKFIIKLKHELELLMYGCKLVIKMVIKMLHEIDMNKLQNYLELIFKFCFVLLEDTQNGKIPPVLGS